MPKKVTLPGYASTTPPQVSYIITKVNNSIQQGTYPSLLPFQRIMGREETITYQTGTGGNFRPCLHKKAIYTAKSLASLGSCQIGVYNPNPGSPLSPKDYRWYNIGADNHRYYYSTYLSGVAAVSLNTASVPWSSLSDSALAAMLPTFYDGNNLVNFIIEMKDFKDVGAKLGLAISLKKKSLLQAIAGFNPKDKPLAKLSKSYLSYSFGWKPLFNDVVSFVQLILGVEARYNELVQRANKPQQSYWGTWISGTDLPEVVHSSSAGRGPTGGWAGSFLAKCKHRVTLGKTDGIRYHATVRYRYPMPPDLTSVIGKLRASLDGLGLSLNPATLWNAIPFTFLIDWVVNIGKWLESLRLDNVQFKTEILDFCHSARIQRSVKYELSLNSYHFATGYLDGPFVTVDQCDKVLYERAVGIPNVLTAIQTSGLNPREFSLAGALIGARLKR